MVGIITSYRCRHFSIHELIDEQTFIQWGEDAWMFLRPEALISLDNIRTYFGKPITVNNWIWGGDLQYRGFRPFYCKVGADYSQHRFGNAFDITVEGIGAEEVRQEILANKNHVAFEAITCLETDIEWVHFDLRNVQDRIWLVKP